jgi:hypothetical protein
LLKLLTNIHHAFVDSVCFLLLHLPRLLNLVLLLSLLLPELLHFGLIIEVPQHKEYSHEHHDEYNHISGPVSDLHLTIPVLLGIVELFELGGVHFGLLCREVHIQASDQVHQCEEPDDVDFGSDRWAGRLLFVRVLLHHRLNIIVLLECCRFMDGLRINTVRLHQTRSSDIYQGRMSFTRALDFRF